MTHGSLFSGIGGFDLAAEWMGWHNEFHCEWMPFPRKVLHHYWPNSKSYEDITKTDFSIHRGSIDILTGGFPCQPYSSAGKRLGKEDERHLWPHMLRAISEIKPTYVVGENVRGLTNWNGGMVFEEVCVDLESKGYEVQPVLLPACAVGAPHRRDRIWFVAYSKSAGTGKNFGRLWSESERCNTRKEDATSATNSESQRSWEQPSENSRWEDRRFNNNDEIRNASNSQCNGGGKDNRVRKSRFNDENSQRNNWQNFPSQSPICGGDDGLSTELDGITFSKWRNESIKGYGNAIVPQVAYQIFKVIAEMDAREKAQMKLF